MDASSTGPGTSSKIDINLNVGKYVAAGNDFLFIDARNTASEGPSWMCEPSLTRSQLAQKICDRHFGVGADGVVFIESSHEHSRLRWDFFNSDGSHAEMCGNATRCVGRWAERNLGLKSVELETVAGLVSIEIDGREVSSKLLYGTTEIAELKYEIQGRRKAAHFVNTGVPHAVIEVNDIQNRSAYLDDIRTLRNHHATGPRGTNVTLLERRGSNVFVTVTFERGVEGFTLSCGTGVLAAAAVGLKGSKDRSADILAPGGEFKVQFQPDGAGVVLTGPARFLFDVSLSEEFFR